MADFSFVGLGGGGPRAGPGDDYDFPPTAHPGCELFTFNLFVLPITTLAVWAGWKLISLI